jgi:glycosyltransferase involved in cell wall biosynthesis
VTAVVTAVDAVRILHLFANFKWTGPADPAIRTAVRLRQLGLDVVFAQAGHTLPRTEHRIAAELAARAVPVVTGLQLRKHFHLPSLAADLAALRALLLRDRYQVVHCHLPADHLLAALACRRLPQPPLLVRTVYEPEAPRLGVRMRYAFRKTAGVVVPTERARQGLVGRCGLDQDRVLRLEPVTEPQHLDGPDQRARWGLGPEHLVVGITARIQPHRRFDLLWDVASRVTAQLPNARFVLLGRGNEVDTRALVTEPIEKRGLQPFVVLPGYQRGPDYHSALRSLDAFLFLVPGSDGTCRAVADAMAFGLPVVATDRGILPELLATRRPGEVPGVACREDAATLAAALLELLRDEGLRRNRGAAALRRAQLDMDPERAARALRAFYQQLLDRREVPR